MTSSSSEPAPDPADLAAMFARTAQDLLSRHGYQDTLDGIVAAALDAVSGCEYAGVMTVRGPAVESPAVSDPLVVRLDDEQRRAGEGPCLEVLVTRDPVLRTEDLQSDPRWPVFGPAAAKLGVRSMLSVELTVGRNENAALNLYASAPNAFDDEAVQLGQIFGMHASMALARARLETQLRTAVDSRAGIGQAVGILMERHRVTAEAAFEMLKVASQKLNIRLRDVAEQVVRTGQEPGDVAKPEG
jgi:GAF domain-containing protein